MPGKGSGAISATRNCLPGWPACLAGRKVLLSSIGGCDFAARPSLDANAQKVFWLPEANPHTVVLTKAPRHAAGSVRLAGDVETVHRDAGDTYLICGRAPSTIQVIAVGAWLDDAPMAALIPLGCADMDHRLGAVKRLCQLLAGRDQPDERLTAYRRQRIVSGLRVLDGRRDGASWRAIGQFMFGPERIAEMPWKSSSLRFQLIRLGEEATRFAAGGYRQLLRGRR